MDSGNGRLIGGRYRLGHSLGAGGFGQVWAAHDVALGVPVALKEIRLGGVSAEERAELLVRAAREARHAARLREHPNIVTVHDVVEVDGAPWIVMQLVEGHSLAEEIRTNGRLTESAAVAVAEALLGALGAAHDAGIIHRDLKPANVMLTPHGDTVLTDFGIAVESADTKLTPSNIVIGTPGYTAPERWQGVAPSSSSDMYSLGVTLYEAIEGQLPFPRENPVAALTQEPRPAQRAGRLEPLLKVLLARNPDARPSADEALVLLSRKRSGSPDIRPTNHPANPFARNTVAGQELRGRKRERAIGNLLFFAAITGIIIWVAAANQRENSTAQPGSTLSIPSRAVSDPLSTPYSPPAPTYTPPVYTPPVYTPPVYTPPVYTPPAFDPATLDSAQTDKTPLTPAALLPDSFTDDKGVYYTQTSGFSRSCLDAGTQHVKAVLRDSGCTNQIIGTYSPHNATIMVVVVIIPMSDKATADATYNSLSDEYSNSWGYWCPKSGVGSELCDRGADISSATQSGWTGTGHRYLFHSLALYVNLGEDPSGKPWTRAAAKAAFDAAGPQNYSGNR
ncbi:serine/threonine-protein kinase [Kitasatospora sp. Ki12]